MPVAEEVLGTEVGASSFVCCGQAANISVVVWGKAAYLVVRHRIASRKLAMNSAVFFQFVLNSHFLSSLALNGYPIIVIGGVYLGRGNVLR